MLKSAWVAPPHAIHKDSIDFNTLEQYDMVKALGLNTIYGLYERAGKDDQEIARAIDHAKAVGIHYFVFDERLQTAKDQSTIKKRSQFYVDRGAKGILVADEPGINAFADLSLSYDAFKKTYDQTFFYVNLLPLHATSAQFTHGAWNGDKNVLKPVDAQTYYNEYAQIGLPYLSYDIYPFEGVFPEIRSDYYEQLELILKTSQTHDLIPIAFIQTCSFAKHVRIPTAAEINFHVNSSLAYGAKGIQYFTYFLPLENELETFKGALVDASGNRTERYDDVQAINAYLDRISRYLIDATIQAVVREETLIKTTFKHKNSTYLMLVNASLTDRHALRLSDYGLLLSSMHAAKNDRYVLEPGEAILMNKEDL
jgi:hypothetical protein